jgi:hypothetical protein
MGPTAAACRAARILAPTARRHAAASVTAISLRASIAHEQQVRALTRALRCTAPGCGLRTTRPSGLHSLCTTFADDSGVCCLLLADGAVLRVVPCSSFSSRCSLLCSHALPCSQRQAACPPWPSSVRARATWCVVHGGSCTGGSLLAAARISLPSCNLPLLLHLWHCSCPSRLRARCSFPPSPRLTLLPHRPPRCLPSRCPARSAPQSLRRSPARSSSRARVVRPGLK